jgi:tripartite-type tricarboxylate transporter receptor subunit TctC
MRLSVICVRLIACVAACAAVGSWAQPYPTKPIRIISPFPPGGTTDVLARIIATEMTKTIGQPVVVENKTGAGGIVGTNAIAQAPADGHTIGLIISAHAVHPGMDTKSRWCAQTPASTRSHHPGRGLRRILPVSS